MPATPRPPAPPPLVLALRRLISRTDAGPLRPLWALLYELLARVVARWAARGERRSAAYLRGSGASRTAVHGVSDLDLVVVLEDAHPLGEARTRVVRRWERTVKRLPSLGALVSVAAYEQAELELAARAPAQTFGLGSSAPQPLFNRDPEIYDPLWLRVRPGVYGPSADWRQLQGPERRTPGPAREAQDDRIAGWLELQWWWRHAIAACLDPSGPRTRYLLVKLVSEPLRILLWLERHERHDDRRAALLRGLEVLPEEERSIRFAISLLDALPREPPPPLAEALAALTRLSRRIAAHLESSVADSGYERVRLRHGSAGSPSIPLADWRALALADPSAESFVAAPGDPGSPETIVEAAGTPAPAGVHPAVRDGELLLLPLRDLWSAGFLRTIQCPLTDPVSFALLDGEQTARFPSVRGWSVTDVAARAIAEHFPRLSDPPEDAALALALALTAARAALLAESAAAGKPELAPTLGDVASALATRGGALGASARDAEALVAAPGAASVPQALAGELLAGVRRLPAYTPAP